jgi:hypothetical protein
MTVSILQSNYIPWKGYFDLIAKSDVFVIYDEVQYTKNDWRNRNIILTPSGNNWLTIPVRVESLNQKICDTKVASINWSRKHYNSIVSNYSKALFFKDYKGFLEELYCENSDFLSEINIKFIRAICDLLGIKTRIIDSRELDLIGNKSEKLLFACEKLNAATYLTGPAAMSYLDTALFKASGVDVKWMDYSNYPTYKQMYEPFNHNVSIIDLILNEGLKTNLFLRNYG